MDDILHGTLNKEKHLTASLVASTTLIGFLTEKVKLSGVISAASQKPVSYHEVHNEFGGDTVIIGG